MTQRTDEELIRRTVSGDQGAFAELMRRYQRRVTVTVRSVLGDVGGDDLADITQDIFLLVYKALPSFRGDSQFGTYLTRIALRHCYRESKRRRRKSSMFFSFGFGSQDQDREPPEERFASTARTDVPVIAEERRTAVVNALQLLPEEFRTVLVLRVVEDLPVEQVAEILNVSTGTVKSRLYRAKDKMRELLAGQDVEFELDTIT